MFLLCVAGEGVVGVGASGVGVSGVGASGVGASGAVVRQKAFRDPFFTEDQQTLFPMEEVRSPGSRQP